jgi:hypothetical protein
VISITPQLQARENLIPEIDLTVTIAPISRLIMFRKSYKSIPNFTRAWNRLRTGASE